MKFLSIIRIFIVAPIFHVWLIMTLFHIDYWYLVLITGIILYYPLHMMGQAIGYHKLFSHRAFEPVNWFPYVSTFCGVISFVGCPATYAYIHRIHHRYADTDKDPHNPMHGMFHAYMGWILTYKYSSINVVQIADLLKKYTWLQHVWKYELLIAILFHITLYYINIYVFSIVLVACLISMHTGFFANAFSHDPRLPDINKAIDKIFLATWVNPIFLHKNHHDYPRKYDAGALGVRDFSVPFIERFLIKDFKKEN